MEWSSLLKPTRVRMITTEKKTDNDFRSEFKKDFDTVCNCTGLRRLQDKAQVFPLEKGDYARTRLTHSIEVMSIAESLGVSAKDVIEEIEKPTDEQKKNYGEIPIILRTAALLHDMGNPPFGHLGEGVISDWFKENFPKLSFDSNKKVQFKLIADEDRKFSNVLTSEHKNDFLKFEGNAQLLRLLAKLNFVTDENAMNLSYPVLATIIKYPCSSTECINANPPSLLKKKPGYFCSEKELYEKINTELQLNHKRHPLTYLLEASDDIAYLSADIEDAQKKGVISFKEIKAYFEDKQYDGDEMVESIRGKIVEYENYGNDIGFPDIENYVMQRLRIFIKGYMISKVKKAFKEHYREIMNGSYENDLLMDSDAKKVVEIIRRIETEKIYYCPEIVKTKIMSYKVLSCLLESFILSAFNAEKNGQKDDRDSLIYNLFSINYRYVADKKAEQILDKQSDEYIYNRLLLVTDVVSGMTDSYAMDYYKLLSANK